MPGHPGSPTPLDRLVAAARAQDMAWRADQTAVTTASILPAMPEIERALARIRRDVDGEVAREPWVGKAAYPVGYCAVIRDRVLARLVDEPLVRQLLHAGAALGPVFVILKGRYFQNAIQFGNLYIDVANDSVDPAKPWLEWMDVREVAFENVGELEPLVRVAEDYHRCQVFPNLLFPLLAPLVPLLAIREGRLELLHFQDGGFLKDLAVGFPHLRHWLAGPGRTMGRLPEAHAALVESACGTNDFDVFPFEYRPCSFDEVAIRADEFVAAAGTQEGQGMILRVLGLVPRAVRQLRDMNLRVASEQTGPAAP
jgi:hypothetical protein